jgi:histidyl-tRNA synthetase
MRDFLPADKAVRDGVMAAIRSSFAAYGYREIETPYVEELDRLTSGDGGDNEKLIYRILRRGLDPAEPVAPAAAADLGLRFDLTVPLTRYYATHRSELPDVFRSIQMGPVWRAERPQKGRYRQFTQCDIDVLGEASWLAEVELVTAALATLDAVGVGDVTVRINHRGILLGVLEACGFPPAARSGVLISVDKLDKIGLSGVADELREGGGSDATVDRLVALLATLGPVDRPPAGTGAADLGPAADVDPADGTAGDGRAAFDATLAALPAAVDAPVAVVAAIRDAVATVRPDARLVADPTLVRGMGYYTGPIFELAHPSTSSSVGGGGRYDGMIGRFAGTDVPAAGISIGFERIVGLVDPDRFGPATRRIALVYGPGVAPSVLVGWQHRLVEDGASVRLVPRIRNTARQLGALAAEGFDSYAVIDDDGAGPDAGAPGNLPTLRPLAASGHP